MQRTPLTTLVLALGLALLTRTTYGGEIGHYVPGLPNIRDFAMPEPGLYGVLYNSFYTSDRLNDGNGNKISSITIAPRGGPGVTLSVDVDVDVYALAPTLIWVSPWKLLGAKYGAYISPSFANASVGASLATQTGRGVDAETSQFAVGDLFVQPLWLGWALTHWDVAFGYGVYAPTGKYDTETVTLPRGATVTTTAADNIGLGFWTHQLQGAVTWYPWAHKATAVVTVLTYEIHGDKEDFDLTPGQNLTWNWGISQFLPLHKDHKLLLEVGLTGYSSWQITDDSGRDARNPSVHDEVHAVGGQLGLTYVPWIASLNVRYFGEFAAQDRFQGHVIGLSVAKKF
jgi:hypothetical protein